MMPAREQVASVLRKRILDGAYHANQVLTLDEVAETTGCSRTPVREAFLVLAAEGLIELSPNRGAMVNELTRSFIDDHYWIREYLEVEACARACRSRTKKLPIRLAIERGAKAATDGDVQAFNEANADFHTAIWRAAESPHLLSFLDQLWKSLALDNAVRSTGMLSSAQKEHELIWQAIENEDEDHAKSAIRNHLENTLRKILENVLNSEH